MTSYKRNNASAFGPVCVMALMLTVCYISMVPGTGAVDLKTLSSAASEATLVFEVAGENVTQSLTIPKKSVVTTATMDLEGIGLVDDTTVTSDYDFNDSTNNKAWWGAANQQATGVPSTYEGNAFAVGDYPNIAKSDDVYKDNSGINNMWAYHHFSFLVPASTIVSIEVIWEGGGHVANMIGNGGAYAFIYNNQSGIWDNVGNFACGDVWCEQTIKYNFTTNPGNYLDENGKVHVLATSRGNGGTTRITTDFVKIVVTGKPTSYPKDPALDVGNDGDNEWTANGLFLTTATVSGAVLVDELNSHITAAGNGSGDVVIVLAVTSGNPGLVRISNILIQFTPYVNGPPELLMDIPSDKSLDEDSYAGDLIDLKNYFQDDHSNILTFTIVSNSDPVNVSATIDAEGNIDFSAPTANWWGEALLVVRATDQDGEYTDSNEFKVTVNSVNDPPMLQSISSPMPGTEGVPFMMRLNATDVDMAYDQSEYLRYYANTTMFAVNPLTGEIDFIPQDKDVGDHEINFSVRDKAGEESYQMAVIMIMDVNNPAILTHIGDRTMKEDSLFTLQLEATDADLKDGLKFSCEVGLFECPTSGLINFTPLQKDVGVSTMKIKVTDGHTWDEEVVNFTVEDVNDAPVPGTILDQTADNRKEFSLTVQGTDEDDQNTDPKYAAFRNHTFTDDSELFDIDPKTGVIKFQATPDDVGKYTVTITMKDEAGLEGTVKFNLTVKLVNTPPTVSISSDKPKPRVSQKFTLTGSATDADGDSLNYTWYGGIFGENVPVGHEIALEQKLLKPGKYTYTLVVSDGLVQTNATYTVSVTAAGNGFIPGIGLEGVFGAIALAAVVVTLVAGRRSRRSQ